LRLTGWLQRIACALRLQTNSTVKDKNTKMGQLAVQMVEKEENSDILFESASNSIVSYYANQDGFADSCAVLFSAWSGRALCGKVGGSDPLLRAGVDVISVQSNCDDWHQSIPPQVLDELAQRLETRYQRRYAYGSSMGGYAALLFAAKLNIDVVLAMSPQYTIQDDFDKRWRLYSDRIDWRYKIADTASVYQGEIYVTYDPYNLDARHFSLIKSHFGSAKITGVTVKFGSHPTTAYFRDAGNLKRVLTDILLKGEVVVAKKCFELGDNRHSMFRHLSNLHARMEDLENAVAYGQKAVDAKDNDESSRKMHLEHLANVQRRLGDLDGALATIDKCLKLDGTRNTAHMNKSIVLLAQNDRQAAVDSALKAIELGDKRHHSYRHLSNVYNRLDDLANSLEYAHKAVNAVDNNENSIKNHLEHLANMQRRSSELDAALQTVDSLLELDADRASAHMTKSAILADRQNNQAAIDSALRAVELRDQSHSTYRHLSGLYVRLGDAEHSLKFAQQAVDAGDNNENSIKASLARSASLSY